MLAWLVVHLVQRVNFGIRSALYPRLPVVALLAVFLPGGERHDENDREPPAERQVHARDLLYGSALEILEVNVVEPHEHVRLHASVLREVQGRHI